MKNCDHTLSLLDLLEEPQPATAPPTTVSVAPVRVPTVYDRLIDAVNVYSVVDAQALRRPDGRPNQTRCARLVNHVLRGVASDRPAVDDARVESAIPRLYETYNRARRAGDVSLRRLIVAGDEHREAREREANRG